MRRTAAAGMLCALLVLGGAALVPACATAGELFGAPGLAEEEGRELAEAAARGRPEVVRARLVAVHTELLRAGGDPEVEVELFPDVVVALVRERMEESSGVLHWIGWAEGASRQRVVLTLRDDRLTGTIPHGGRLFEVAPTRTGGPVHVVLEIDPGRFEELPDDTPPAPSPP